MCATACPVLINTGDLVRRLRRDERGWAADKAWTLAARHWDGASRIAGAALSVAHTVPSGLASGASRVGRSLLGADSVPQWSADLPRGGHSRRRAAAVGRVDAVYLPSCVSAMFGPVNGGTGVQESFEYLCARAGLVLHVPENIDSLCCGTPWSSKGMTDGYRTMREHIVASVVQASRDGELGIISDASSCTEGLAKILKEDAPHVRVVDAVTVVAERILPVLGEHPKIDSLTVHPTCSSTQLGVNDALLAVANNAADEVVIPLDWGCCGFAGDRGMLHPELTASATDVQARQVRAHPTQSHVSCNRTCEMAMTRATGRPYRHVIELLAELTDTASAAAKLAAPQAGSR